MSEISKYEAYKKKLQGICDENDLTFRINNTTYPITLTVRPVSDMYTQMSMLENIEEKEYRSSNAYLKFVYKDGNITYKTSETFAISDALFSKLKNLFKNLHYYWLQYFFRNVIEQKSLIPGRMPVIDEDEANDIDALPEAAEPLEELDVPVLECATDGEIEEATGIVRMENKASTALIQRRMNVDEERAKLIISALEDNGVIGPYNNSESREVLPYDEPDDGGADDAE